MRYEFVLYFVSISQAVPVDIPYKEGTDRTLLRQIQITAVYWSGVLTKLWYCVLFQNDTTFLRCSQTVVNSSVKPLSLTCV